MLAPNTETSDKTQSFQEAAEPTGPKERSLPLKAIPVPQWQVDIAVGRDQLYIVLWGETEHFELASLF